MRDDKSRQKCEVYSRVVGFLTPVSQWNRGKKEEFKDRRTYDQALNEARKIEEVDTVLRQ